jgi:predicted O-methyltransferase YrrM
MYVYIMGFLFMYQELELIKFNRAVEIGTSTGRSTICIAWALDKTGGKVSTIEMN